MRIFSSIILYIFLIANTSRASSHLILKSDFNGDGIADRVVFASYGISGFVQSTFANKKVDTFFFKQGNRSIFYTSHTTDGVPYIKLTEEAGFYSVVTLMKYEDRVFKHVTSYSLPGEVYFSDDFFADTIVTTANSSKNSSRECNRSNIVFNNKATTAALTWADMLKQYSLEETIKKSIDGSCKKVFGSEYEKLEKDILEACRIESTPDTKKQNSLIVCLDKNIGTRTTSSLYQRVLAATVFENGFKITCDDIKKEAPKAAFNKNTKNVSLFQTTPPEKGRSYKADFFHELIHSTGVKADNKVTPLVTKCLGFKNMRSNLDRSDDRVYISNLTEQAKERKDGVEVNIPPQVKQIPQTSVAAAVNEGSKTLDNNFEMDNSTQNEILSGVSKRAMSSFDPLMKVAYEAAVPTAFAQGSLASNNGNGSTSAASSSTVALPTTKAAAPSTRAIASASSGNSNSVASGVVYDVSSLPPSVGASDKGDLGNGLSVKASAVNVKENTARAPSSTGASNEASPGEGTGAISTGGSGKLGYAPTSERLDLRNNVPRLKAEEDIVKTFTTGKYEEVKARLTDPKNKRILEDNGIQYVAQDQTLGSTKPVIILKDLGNKFSIVRVTIE